MKRYNKLVRDRIPEMIERDGRVPDFMILSAERYHEYLDDKIEEELTEYRASREHIELMDIVEVVQAIVESEGVSWEEFEAARNERRIERGGFAKRVWLRSVR